MKFVSRLVIFSLICMVASAAPPEVYKQIRINVPDRSTLGRVFDSGLDICGTTGKVGGWMEFVAAPYELEQLAAKGIAYDVVVEDLAAYYRQRMSPVPENALGFGYGSMGGFYTLAEVNQQLDSMHLLYPSLITARESVGVSVEGRVMWAVKISDNPGVDEPGEPEVLYTALHHAREPEGMMAVLYYMWWLLQNHGTDAEATYLVDNREMWFIPVMNVDGYFYNQTTNASGGGLWRKNRRYNGGTIYGVDLNRNYGPTYMWNASNNGSSTAPASDTYRGTSAFSEPETRAIDAFVRAHSFKTALNYHTYSNLLIYPWGYLSQESGDSLKFRDWTYDMTAVSRYRTGTDLQTVQYATRGNSDDFMYGDSTKPSVNAMTPEVGSTGFWPTVGEILPLAVENLSPNKFISTAAGFLPRLRGVRIVEPDSNGSLSAGENFILEAQIRNLGVGPAAGLSVEASADVPWVIFAPSTVTVGPVPAQAVQEVQLQGTLDSLAPAAARFRVFLRWLDTDGYAKRDTVYLYAGQPSLLFADSARTGTSNWSTGTGWGTTALAHTAPLAFTDSPSGNYPANTNNSLTMLGTVNLLSYQFAQLRFWVRWALETAYDFATVELSTNSGSSWAALRTEASRRGSGLSALQPTGSYGYDAYGPGLTWTEQFVDLTPYVGRQIKLRFRLASDGGDERDGISVDDIRVYGYSTAVPPSAPALATPADGTISVPSSAVLRWHLTGGAATYQVQLSPDSVFAALVVNDSTVTDTTRPVAGLLPGVTCFWRVRARNGAGSGPYSPVWRFSTQGSITRVFPVQQFWNLVSLPLTVADPSGAAIFPQASSSLYAFQPATGYHPADTLRGSVGYWVKFDSAASVEITGLPLTADTIPVLQGWNLIGSIGEPLDTAAVVQIPAGILESPYFWFDAVGTYAPADTLRPAHGYWVKSGQAGSLILQSTGGTNIVRKRGGEQNMRPGE